MLCVSFRDFLADVPVVLVVQVPMGAVVEETVELRPLHSMRNFLRGAAHQRVDELMGCLFRALHTGAGPEVVSTGTRPPQLGASVMTYRQRHVINFTVRTTTTTTTTTTTLRGHFGSRPKQVARVCVGDSLLCL